MLSIKPCRNACAEDSWELAHKEPFGNSQLMNGMPLVSRNVKIGDQYYLDGGISDAIPLQKSIVDGNRKNVVIMTKEIGYIRKPSTFTELVKLRYLNFPKVYDLMRDRHINYNETLEYIERQRECGGAFVIRPK